MSQPGKYLFLVLVFPGGCVTNDAKHEVVQPSKDKGPAVYIYRPDSFSNVVISPVVIIDGEERFLIKSGNYTFVYLEPGRHAFKLKLDKHYKGGFERVLHVKPEREYFLRVDTSMKFVKGQPYTRSFNLNQMQDEKGLNDLKECKYVKPEMPSKYLWKKSQSGEEARFTTDKTSDPFSRNK